MNFYICFTPGVSSIFRVYDKTFYYQIKYNVFLLVFMDIDKSMTLVAAVNNCFILYILYAVSFNEFGNKLISKSIHLWYEIHISKKE